MDQRLVDRVAASRSAAERAKTFATERSLIWLRLGVVAAALLTYPFLYKAGHLPWLAWVSLCGAAAWTLALLALSLRRPSPRTPGRLVAIVDAGLAVLWLGATGGPFSAYVPLLYVWTFATGLRWSAREAVVASTIFGGAYAGLVAGMGLLPDQGLLLVIQLMFLALSAGLGVVASRFALEQGASAHRLALEAAEHERTTGRLREQERMLVEAQALARLGSWNWEIDRDEIRWSQELYRIFGVHPDEPVGGYESYLAHVHPEDRAEVDAWIRESLATAAPYAFEHRILLADGEVRWVHSRGQVDFGEDGRPVRIHGIAQDVTEHKEAQRLEQYATELERSNTELQQFAYAVSHDLTDPLRMVSQYLQLLARRYEDRLDEEGREFIRYAVDGAERMHELIRSLLQYSRVASETQPLAPTPIGDVLDEVLLDLGPRIAECGAEIRRGTLPVVLADRVQVRQLLQNLVANALKFCPDHSPRIRVDAQEDKGQWRISVRDNGIGLDTSQSEKIFQVFGRLHERTAYPGTGIGLAICKRIVDRHGGRIWVESEPGRGATFHFTLPRPLHTRIPSIPPDRAMSA